MNNVGDKKQESERIGIERTGEDLLGQHPGQDKNSKKIDSIHGADDAGNSDGHFIVVFEATFVLKVDVFGLAAVFEIFVKTVGHMYTITLDAEIYYIDAGGFDRDIFVWSRPA